MEEVDRTWLASLLERFILYPLSTKPSLFPASMTELLHLTREQLEAGLDHIRHSPGDAGRLDMIVRRPAENLREELHEGELNTAEGLAGDTWNIRRSSRAPDHPPSPERQITIMNSRMIALAAQGESRRALAGDQLYVDMDLSLDNIPPGTRLSLGSAILEVTDQIHTGCDKFVARFGVEAMKFVNSETGRSLRLRGMYARVAQPGTIRLGERMTKMKDEAIDV